MLAWHSLPKDMRLRHGDGRKVYGGVWMDAKVSTGYCGGDRLYAYISPAKALGVNHGLLCRVEIDTTKNLEVRNGIISCARRKLLWYVDEDWLMGELDKQNSLNKNIKSIFKQIQASELNSFNDAEKISDLVSKFNIEYKKIRRNPYTDEEIMKVLDASEWEK